MITNVDKSIPMQKGVSITDQATIDFLNQLNAMGQTHKP